MHLCFLKGHPNSVVVSIITICNARGKGFDSTALAIEWIDLHHQICEIKIFQFYILQQAKHDFVFHPRQIEREVEGGHKEKESSHTRSLDSHVSCEVLRLLVRVVGHESWQQEGVHECMCVTRTVSQTSRIIV